MLCDIWDLGLTKMHVSRSYWTSYGVCYAWLAVPPWIGFVFEFIGSLLCNVFSSIIFDFELIPKLNIHKRILLSSSVTTTLVLISFHKTGGFFQPLLAFIRTFGCVGALQEVTILDHIIVYWIGATLGAIIAMFFVRLVKKIQQKRSRTKTYKIKDLKAEDPLLENVDVF